MKREQSLISPSNLDAKDYEILALLQRNAKMTVREVAQGISLSTTPTHERIKRLEREGVIKEYTAIIDRKQVNRGIMVLCMIALSVHNKKAAAQFIDQVKRFDEVLEFYNISGDFDFMLKIVASSMDEFHDFFVNQLSEVDGIGQTKSIFVMNSIKETHCLF
ncbi:Lrp/AsnC family transcriptional regulator [Sphingobacterium sp. SYP-B4668]|uniref:Lrp/AsnC family transcriptional regulator n=1 Tax=Sphingobacterium sp. SYP-B4668 TaxID=2996035 RepID=UPI0022DDC973|nr:Lrp/AsnC family transcriptional regulator [Sphingobacterium sp. SYP-B4668]